MKDIDSRAGWIWAQFRPAKGALTALLIMSCIQSAVQVGYAVAMRSVIDSGLSGSGDFRIWVAVMALTIALMAVLRWTRMTVAGRTEDLCSAQLRSQLLMAVENSDGDRIQRYHSGTVINRAYEDVKTVSNGVIVFIPTVAGNLTRLVFSLAGMAWLSPVMALIVMAVGIVAAAAAAGLRPVFRRLHMNIRRSEEQAYSKMQEDAGEIELIEALQAQVESVRRFEGLQDKAVEARRRGRLFSVSVDTAASLALSLGSVVVIIWGVVAIGSGRMTYGELTALLQLLALVRGPALSLPNISGRLATIDVSAGRLIELLEVPAMTHDMPDANHIRAKAVVFDHVTFRYTDEEPPVLEGYSARFMLDRWTCVTGLSGRGKSTVLKLILGIYRPQTGRVYLETDSGEIQCGADTRQIFAYVPQSSALFSGTVLDNLRLVKPDADIGSCERALRLAGAGFVLELPNGLDTKLREQNAGLSIGQLQRIAIARALLMERQVLLLDECTSALDHDTELMVLRSLKTLDVGVILITHHPEAMSCIEGVESVDMEGDR